jgi:predicted phosphoribosyltransferase
MAELLENKALRDRTRVFADRNDAGLQLAEMLRPGTGPETLVLAIPSGGVPVGFEIAAALGLDFDLVLVRKVQIPWNTEAGFAAINMDADLFVNEHLLSLLNLTDEQIESQVAKTMAVIEKRHRKFRQDRPFPEVAGRAIILVDDGLASGYTMKGAVAYLKKRSPLSITVAVPTGSAETVKMLLKEVDSLCCLNIRGGYPYAVASAYRNWYDLDDEDVIRILGKKRKH